MGRFVLRVGLGSRGCGAAAVSSRLWPRSCPSGSLSFAVVLLARLAFLSRLGGSFRSLLGKNMRKRPPRVGIFPAFFRFPSPLRDSGFGGAAIVQFIRGRASGSRLDAGLVWSVCACSSVLVCRLCALVWWRVMSRPDARWPFVAVRWPRSVFDLTLPGGVGHCAACRPWPEKCRRYVQ